jgi:hypothetical protein
MTETEDLPARSRSSVGIVTQFLCDALSSGMAIGVPELEAMARTAGLLGEHQRIAHAKLFKKAKKSLGIRSIRNGFGSTGEWFWSLEKPAAESDTWPSSGRLVRLPPIGDTYAGDQNQIALIDDPEEPPADSRAHHIPSSWIDGVARLNRRRSFIDVPPPRWRQFLDDCNNFLTSDQKWAERAAELGWNAIALFGCSPNRPLSYLGSAGLMWVINGGRLVELHRDWAVIELAENGSRRVIERRRVDTTKAILPWVEDRERSGA